MPHDRGKRMLISVLQSTACVLVDRSDRACRDNEQRRVTRDQKPTRFSIRNETDSQRGTRHTSQHRHHTTRRHSLG